MANTKSSTILEFDNEAIKARENQVARETNDQIVERLRERFQILDHMTKAVKRGEVKSLIVSGPPGVGKSFGVEYVLEKDGLFDVLAERKPRFQVVKGALSALGLYAKLFEFSDSKNVLVFDDADQIFFDDLSLNILKAALDSGNRRFINWNTDSRLLRSEGIPNRFEFKGGVIFITNLNFAHIKSKKLKDHLDALESRCHYIDLEMSTMRERLLRIKQITQDGMLEKYDFDSPEIAQDEILEFITANQDKFREMSLRTVLKVADLRKAFPSNWQAMAKTTLMRRV